MPKSGVMIAVGIPKHGGGGDDIGAPDELDAAPKGKMAEHEAAETPAEEGGEDYATRLVSDMMKPLIDAGAEEGDAKKLLADIFRGMADCLAGGGKKESGEYNDATDSYPGMPNGPARGGMMRGGQEQE